MKRYELFAVEHAKRFTKAWDYFCIATDAFFAGYRKGKEYIPKHDNEVEVDIEHQLTAASFEKWKEEVRSLPFKTAIVDMMPDYEFTDLRAHIDSNGVVSFQGVAKKL